MKCHPARWAWGLIPIAMLSWIAVHAEVDRIERDLEQRARSVLDAAGYDWASIVFSGRDGMLAGTPPQAQGQAEALALVRKIWGVRTVRLRKTVVRELALAASARLHSRGGDRLSVLRPVEAVLLQDMVPSVVVAAAPAVLVDPRPSPVVAYERDASSTSIIRAAEAQRTQAHAPAQAISTAALPEDALSAADACGAAVRQIRTSETVHFSRGEADLDRHSRHLLDRLAMATSACPQLKLTIAGHADADGPARRNLVLSKRRARVVVSYLITRGIDAGRLEAVGYGETRPVAPNDSARNRAKNRRIEVEVRQPRAIEQVPDSAAGQGADNGLPDH